ncbi:hypothetical protein CSG_14550 [Campylobacter fetus subsp. venerealis str. 84-112]|uniref:Uncharacterized protein n=1 Tax=Campylobacter fetus subsp. fetus (strain 82-40) TaxID=360106 RepID=A0RQH8_CAMFF|nr:hypothetical protein CFF8240_1308 [Campylobacter fetus subsp. fetus 82-40]CDF65366.1 hypothetical protein CSG_14550 [Campylobacter fetus subsp. venerealis str. 84-112]
MGVREFILDIYPSESWIFKLLFRTASLYKLHSFLLCSYLIVSK